MQYILWIRFSQVIEQMICNRILGEKNIKNFDSKLFAFFFYCLFLIARGYFGFAIELNWQELEKYGKQRGGGLLIACQIMNITDEASVVMAG